MKPVLYFALNVAGYLVSVLLVTQVTDHGFDFVAWKLTAPLVVSWSIWAIFMAAIMRLLRRRVAR